MISANVVTLDLSRASALIDAHAKKLARPGDGFMIAARAVGNELKKHFREKNQDPNKEGYPKSGFWAQIRDSVQVVKLGEGAVVQVNDPRFNQKLHGGTITPKEAKALAVPLEAEFYGVRPSTFGDRFFFLPNHGGGKTVGILAEHLADTSIRAAYVLLSSADQEADPTALPDLGKLERVAVTALEGWIRRQLAAPA